MTFSNATLPASFYQGSEIQQRNLLGKIEFLLKFSKIWQSGPNPFLNLHQKSIDNTHLGLCFGKASTVQQMLALELDELQMKGFDPLQAAEHLLENSQIIGLLKTLAGLSLADCMVMAMITEPQLLPILRERNHDAFMTEYRIQSQNFVKAQALLLAWNMPTEKLITLCDLALNRLWPVLERIVLVQEHQLDMNYVLQNGNLLPREELGGVFDEASFIAFFEKLEFAPNTQLAVHAALHTENLSVIGGTVSLAYDPNQPPKIFASRAEAAKYIWDGFKKMATAKHTPCIIQTFSLSSVAPTEAMLEHNRQVQSEALATQAALSLLNTTLPTGETLLISAVNRGAAQLVAQLVQYDAVNVNLADGKGGTPLAYAQKRGNLEILQRLGSRPDLVSASGVFDKKPPQSADKKEDLSTRPALATLPLVPRWIMPDSIETPRQLADIVHRYLEIDSNVTEAEVLAAIACDSPFIGLQQANGETLLHKLLHHIERAKPLLPSLLGNIFGISSLNAVLVSVTMAPAWQGTPLQIAYAQGSAVWHRFSAILFANRSSFNLIDLNIPHPVTGLTLLQQVVRAGDKETLSEFLYLRKKNVISIDINHADPQGKTIIFDLIEQGFREEALILLEGTYRGVAVNLQQVDAQGQNLLVIAQKSEAQDALAKYLKATIIAITPPSAFVNSSNAFTAASAAANEVKSGHPKEDPTTDFGSKP